MKTNIEEIMKNLITEASESEDHQQV
jgi:hypothetical protein